MIRRFHAGLALLSAAAFTLPAVAAAQTFKTQKYDIKGEGRTDYIFAEPGTGRVFVSRSTHVMVVEGATGKVLGDITDAPGNHGIAVSEKDGHGFTSNGGDSSVTMFDLKTLAVIKKIHIPTGGLDGIMYDDGMDRIILTNHSRPIGTLVALDAKSGDIVGTVNLEDSAPEGAASDGKGKLYVNLEGKSAMQVIDQKTFTSVAVWPLAPCDGPTGIAMDRGANRLFVGCGTQSLVVDPSNGRIVAQIPNGDGVDALGYDASQKLIYIPAGRAGNVTVAHMDSPDKYTVVATVESFAGAKTIGVDPVKHMAYLFQPEYGPAPTPPAGTPPPAGGRGGRGPARPIVAAWFIAISH